MLCIVFFPFDRERAAAKAIAEDAKKPKDAKKKEAAQKDTRRGENERGRRLVYRVTWVSTSLHTVR